MMLETEVLAWDRHTNVAGLNICIVHIIKEIFIWTFTICDVKRYPEAPCLVKITSD